jgi:hypothetical protein
MQVGDLVKMKDEPSEIMGMIIATESLLRDPEVVYKIQWFCDLCDISYATSDSLEVVCK